MYKIKYKYFIFYSIIPTRTFRNDDYIDFVFETSQQVRYRKRVFNKFIYLHTTHNIVYAYNPSTFKGNNIIEFSWKKIKFKFKKNIFYFVLL